MKTDVATTARKKLTKKERLACWERDGGICYLCSRKLAHGEKWIAEHPKALGLGGKDDRALLRVACQPCSDVKTHGDDNPRIAAAKRQKAASLGIKDEDAKKIESPSFAPGKRRQKNPIDSLPPRQLYRSA